MPTLVDQFALWRALDAFERTMQSISIEGGYNTSPVTSFGAKSMKDIPDGEYPHLVLQFEDLQLVQEEFGGASLGILRFEWPAFVIGYVKSSGHRKNLYKAGLSLLVDVLAAIYADEAMKDADGQGTVLFVQPGEIQFDMEAYSSENRGFFVAEFGLVVDLTRGGSP